MEEEEKCFNCGYCLEDNDYIQEGQSVPYGMGSVTEFYVVGYQCPECGEKEKF